MARYVLGNDAKAEHSNLSWMSMLFAARNGYWFDVLGCCRASQHFTGWYETPLGVEAYSPEAAKLALECFICNFGAYAAGIYAIWRCALFFTFNKKFPLSIRSIFYPIRG
ncbi:BCCT family transporter [Vibrio chagasii]|nr:BCCT family transporter [Vibrio chagasii]